MGLSYKTMSKPLVSIVCPCYNKAQTLGQSIQSIIDQSFTNWELILVDDCSTDNTQELLNTIHLQDIDESNIRKDRRIKKVYLPMNMGVVAAYRQGIMKARGKYIMFHDSDDMSLPDRIDKCLANIGDADVLYHGLYLIAKHAINPTTARRYKTVQEWTPDRIYTEQYIPGIIFAKASLLKKVVFPKEAKNAWDWMHHILLHQMGAKYVALNEGLYEYFRFPGNSLSYSNEVSGARQKSIKWIQQYLIKNKIVKKNHKFGKGFMAYIGDKKEQPNI